MMMGVSQSSRHLTQKHKLREETWTREVFGKVATRGNTTIMMERWILEQDELAENVQRCLDIFLEVGKELGLIIDVAITRDK